MSYSPKSGVGGRCYWLSLQQLTETHTRQIELYCIVKFFEYPYIVLLILGDEYILKLVMPAKG